MPVHEFVEIAPGVVVTTSDKYVTTSTIVVRDGRALLVDPAWTADELDGILAWLGAHGAAVSAGFSTHAHHDHVLWHPAFGPVPRWASPRSVELTGEWHDELFEHLSPYLRPGWPDPMVGLAPLPDEVVPEPFGPAGNEEVRVVVHDGHAPGHSAVWLPERGVLLAGDMLSDVELPLPFEPDDLAAYLDGLDRLAEVVSRSSLLVPGHGHVTDRPLARLDADRRYLDDVLHGRDPDDPRRAHAGMEEAHQRIVVLVRDLPR